MHLIGCLHLSRQLVAPKLLSVGGSLGDGGSFLAKAGFWSLVFRAASAAGLETRDRADSEVLRSLRHEPGPDQISRRTKPGYYSVFWFCAVLRGIARVKFSKFEVPPPQL